MRGYTWYPGPITNQQSHKSNRRKPAARVAKSKEGEGKNSDEEKVNAAPANTQAALEERSKISKDKCLTVLAELRHQNKYLFNQILYIANRSFNV